MSLTRDYSAQWLKLGYAMPMASSSFLQPPDQNNVRAYHLVCSEYALENIEKERIKVCRFADANDPFELLALNCHDPKIAKLTRKFCESENGKRGFISFSENWNSPLLWSQYAAQHRGICLGFDVSRGKVETIEYADRRLRAALLDGDEPTIPPLLRDKLCRAKSKEWSYERELRIMVNLDDATAEGALYFWPFACGLHLAEVILGPRCDRSLTEVKAIANLPTTAVVFRARLARREFKVVLDGNAAQ